jgi:ATP-dependent helicase/nuclease subunit B
MPRVFTIAPGVPFLKTLAEALCTGELVPGFLDNGDPLCLADVTIYVPTRRAARALRSVFAERGASKTAILPTIRPLGEFEEDAGFFDEAGAVSLALDPPIEPEERILELAKLVRHWAGYLPTHIRALFGSDPLVLPSTPADAVWLARNLADLMDEVARENGDWTALDALVPDELAGWWQLTLEFMSIVSKQWPHYLKDNGLSDPVPFRNAIMRTETERLKREGARGPIIAAGSTGSLPATAELLQVIASLPQGAVVLPGLDKAMDEESWAALVPDDKTPSVYGHPQYGLKKLLQRFGVLRDGVEEIGAPHQEIAIRNAAISNALMPAETTYKWSEARAADATTGFTNVSEIVAANEAQEAIAIAVALREAVQANAVPAALVTTDRTLARRVSAELERFGIKADDSGGTPLDQSPPAALFRLMLDVVFRPTDPVSLLALLKHPLASLGKARAKTRRDAEVLELLALRGGVVSLELPSVLEALKSVGVGHERSFMPSYLKRIKAAPTEHAVDLALALSNAITPLMHFAASTDTVTVARAVKISIEAFEALGRDETGGLAKLYEGDAGEALAKHLRALLLTKGDFSFEPYEWPSIYNALMSGQTVKPRSGSDPRVHIWGALEARLQPIETIVLGGLNEKTWPARPADDPLLSRGMKAGINIEPPERRVGLAAHDFQMLMGTKRVILSRSVRLEGAPSVPSRWLQRVHALIGRDAVKAMQARAAHYAHWGRQLDLGLAPISEPRPCPTPALHLRPTSFSVTEITKLRRDPYAIHAKRILGLEPLEPLLREPDAQERGHLFHQIVEEFVRSRKTPIGTAFELTTIGEQLFDEAGLPEDTRALWWRRFERMVDEFIALEAHRAPLITTSHVELTSTKIVIADTGVTLNGRADRIDLLPGGSSEIIDYKTGTVPSAKQALSLMEPQLALEAALLARGGFFDGRSIPTSDLAYIELKANGAVNHKSIILSKSNKEPLTGDQLAQQAWEKLINLVEYFSIEENGYISRNAPFKEAIVGDYDHLARVAEWSGGGEDDLDGADAS